MAREDILQVIDYVQQNGPVTFEELKAQFPNLVTNATMPILRRQLAFTLVREGDTMKHMVSAK